MIDGDTLDVGGVRVRLHGIDAPETRQTCTSNQGVEWACGAWVNDEVRRRLEGRTIVCQEVDRDKYKRVVATCSVDGKDISEALVFEGLAFAYLKYSKAYALQESYAAQEHRGLHASLVQSPAKFRASRAQGRTPPNDSCVIKGNVSSKGERIFHIPGGAFYERTGINTSSGERWFCSVKEAQSAGWRAARS